MRYLKLFENFQESDTLYIFDFDDTLVKSPSFEELVIRYLNGENLPEVERLVSRSLLHLSKPLDTPLIIENGKIYIEDKLGLLEPKGNWVKKGIGLKMVTPNIFHSLDISFPGLRLTDGEKKENFLNKPISNLYQSVENKAIVTGRMLKLEDKVINCLKNLGLGLPNHGLYCFPLKDDSSDRVAEWKAKKIVELIKKTGFKNAKFYDDRSKWVRRVVLEVNKQLPDVTFEGIRVN